MRQLIFFILFALIGPQKTSAQQDSTASDSVLNKQVEQQMQQSSQVNQTATQSRSSISTNPNISVIGDFQSSYQSSIRRKLDIYFNEAEFSFQSFVDPYARADFFLSLSRNPTTDKFEADIEEAYITTIDLPASLQLKVGKFRMAFGRINPVHPHALPFVDLPSAYQNYFGDGLNDEGLSLNWLVPNPFDFYQELTLEATNGPTDNPSFMRSTSSRYLYLAHFKNFFDLNDNATLELGLTGMVGPNDSSFTTTIGAFDLTYKWKPIQFNTYQSLVWQTEALFSKAKYAVDKNINSWGIYSFLTYQIEKRWFLTGRFDYSNKPFSYSMVDRAYSASIGWYATEFQKIELESIYNTSNYQNNFTQAFLRWIFVIGAHGAHQY